MVEHGIRNYFDAKQKAANRLGGGTRDLPKNHEIEAARLEYQRLFKARHHSRWLHHLRKVALQAMQQLSAFNPCLVGPVLAGSAGKHDAITLHLFTDTTEEIAFTLIEKQIPFTTNSFDLRLNGIRQTLPGYSFVADDIDIELVVFPTGGIRQAPLSPVNGKPMRRAPIHQVERLLTGQQQIAHPS